MFQYFDYEQQQFGKLRRLYFIAASFGFLLQAFDLILQKNIAFENFGILLEILVNIIYLKNLSYKQRNSKKFNIVCFFANSIILSALLLSSTHSSKHSLQNLVILFFQQNIFKSLGLLALSKLYCFFALVQSLVTQLVLLVLTFFILMFKFELQNDLYFYSFLVILAFNLYIVQVLFMFELYFSIINALYHIKQILKNFIQQNQSPCYLYQIDSLENKIQINTDFQSKIQFINPFLKQDQTNFLDNLYPQDSEVKASQHILQNCQKKSNKKTYYEYHKTQLLNNCQYIIKLNSPKEARDNRCSFSDEGIQIKNSSDRILFPKNNFSRKDEEDLFICYSKRLQNEQNLKEEVNCELNHQIENDSDKLNPQYQKYSALQDSQINQFNNIEFDLINQKKMNITVLNFSNQNKNFVLVQFLENQELILDYEKSLIKKIKRLQINESNKERMLAQIAHDFKTPLNGMIAIVEYLTQQFKNNYIKQIH